LEVTIRPGDENVHLKARVVFVEAASGERPSEEGRFGIKFLGTSKEKFYKTMPFFEESISEIE